MRADPSFCPIDVIYSKIVVRNPNNLLGGLAPRENAIVGCTLALDTEPKSGLDLE